MRFSGCPLMEESVIEFQVQDRDYRQTQYRSNQKRPDKTKRRLVSRRFSQKRTNIFFCLLFCFLRQTKEICLFVFLGESTARQNCFWFYLTFTVTLTYMIIYFQNFLNNFPVDTPLMIAARLMLLFQLITVFPLLMYILRSQFFMLVLKTENVGYKKIILLNLIVVGISILFAIFMPTIGNIIRYVGGLCGAVVVFILPSMAYLKSAKQDGKLKWFTLALYCPIIYFGTANFFAQFSV